jgi:hypothetical protein
VALAGKDGPNGGYPTSLTASPDLRDTIDLEKGAACQRIYSVQSIGMVTAHIDDRAVGRHVQTDPKCIPPGDPGRDRTDLTSRRSGFDGGRSKRIQLLPTQRKIDPSEGFKLGPGSFDILLNRWTLKPQ